MKKNLIARCTALARYNCGIGQEILPDSEPSTPLSWSLKKDYRSPYFAVISDLFDIQFLYHLQIVAE